MFVERNPSEFMDWNSFEIDWPRMEPRLLSEGLSKQDIDSSRNIKKTSEIPFELIECDGQHVLQLVAAAIACYRPKGISPDRVVDQQGLLSMLRVAFKLDELEKDRMFWEIRAWERVNTRFKVLSSWRALDPLGAIWDQRYWESDLNRLLELQSRTDPFVIFQLDLDHFKNVNDSLGHTAGDQAIRLCCETVKAVVGSVAEIYRRGGDEIIAFAPDLPDLRARELAEKLRAKIELEFAGWAKNYSLTPSPTASIGAICDVASRPAHELISLVDEAQRKAKELGRNRVIFAE